mmetsp:Transcript_61187/g.177422  ORF Transcript_61187/g.177422 Transcript_61187/m.177422 type:complete len:304 (+) Transcript_61187:249-1160(+)
MPVRCDADAVRGVGGNRTLRGRLEYSLCKLRQKPRCHPTHKDVRNVERGLSAGLHLEASEVLPRPDENPRLHDEGAWREGRGLLMLLPSGVIRRQAAGDHGKGAGLVVIGDEHLLQAHLLLEKNARGNEPHLAMLALFADRHCAALGDDRVPGLPEGGLFPHRRPTNEDDVGGDGAAFWSRNRTVAPNVHALAHHPVKYLDVERWAGATWVSGKTEGLRIHVHVYAQAPQGVTFHWLASGTALAPCRALQLPQQGQRLGVLGARPQGLHVCGAPGLCLLVGVGRLPCSDRVQQLALGFQDVAT